MIICEHCKKECNKYNVHHISYFPEDLMIVCIPCHRKIHIEKDPKLCPSKHHTQVFYSLKGWIRDSRGFGIRKLTKEEWELKNGK